jgi:hypothetical protein
MARATRSNMPRVLHEVAGLVALQVALSQDRQRVFREGWIRHRQFTSISFWLSTAPFLALMRQNILEPEPRFERKFAPLATEKGSA